MLILKRDFEKALTALIIGVERGCAKCAYGVAYLAHMLDSSQMSEDEAQRIFNPFYYQLKAMAEAGDDEASTMVAKSIFLGFVEDDESYFEWLEGPLENNYPPAIELLREIEQSEESILEETEVYDKHGMPILQESIIGCELDLSSDESIDHFTDLLHKKNLGNASALRGEVTKTELEDYNDIVELLEENKKQDELNKASFEGKYDIA